MKTNKIITTLGLAAMLGTFGYASSSLAAEKSAQKNWMPMQQVLTQVENAGFTDIREIERERGTYEVKAVNNEGNLSKIIIDGETGEVLKQYTLDKKGKMNKADRRHQMRDRDNCDMKKGDN